MSIFSLTRIFLFIAVGSAAIPVCDIRGVDSLNYSKQEKIIRCKTASLYRLADIFGMSNSLITVSLTSTHTYTRTRAHFAVQLTPTELQKELQLLHSGKVKIFFLLWS